MTDARSEVLEEWAVTTGLTVLNRGSVQTCVRTPVGSGVDVSFASPALKDRIRECRDAAELETLSDHRYIHYDVGCRSSPVPRTDGPHGPHKGIERELLEEAAVVQAWIREGRRR